jgi:hypothetical protein
VRDVFRAGSSRSTPSGCAGSTRPSARTRTDALRSRRARGDRRADARIANHPTGVGFLRLLGRTYNEPDRDLVRMLRRDHGATLERFRAALARALPDLPRSSCSCASTSRSARSPIHLEATRAAARRRVAGAARSWEDILRDLMPFLVAGFAAPRARARREPRRGLK